MAVLLPCLLRPCAKTLTQRLQQARRELRRYLTVHRPYRYSWYSESEYCCAVMLFRSALWYLYVSKA